MEPEEKVTIEDYLNEKFPKENKDDSEIAGYLADKFDITDLPGDNKRRMTVPEMLKAAQDNKI